MTSADPRFVLEKQDCELPALGGTMTRGQQLTLAANAYRLDMNTTQESELIPVRLDFDRHAALFSAAVTALDEAATKTLDAVEFDPRLRELVRIRASQLNGCAYCVDMHSKDARAAGETEQRIYALSVWEETPFYTARERAALAFTESVTTMATTHVPARDYESVAEHFSPEEIAALLSLIIAINAWNTLGVATRAWEAGSYLVSS